MICVTDGMINVSQPVKLNELIDEMEMKFGYYRFNRITRTPPSEEKQYMTFGKYMKIAEELREKN